MSKYHLEQLLGNIFSNIKRHTPVESQIEVTLKARAGGIELIIQDSGAGLPESFYRKGIQAFQRFDKSRSRQSGGSGLGMTIMEKIVSKNGGQIRLSESKFGGLKIQINLP
jgi:two-component system OmpR family sensor kinase